MRKSSREQKLILNEADSERVCVCECVCEGISFRMHFSHINFTITFWTNNQVASVWAGIEKCYLNAAADFHLWATKRGISLGSSGLLIVSWNQSEDSAKCVVCVNVSLRGQLYPTYLPPSLPLPKDTKQKYDQKLSVTRAPNANEGAWIMYKQR